VEAGVDDFNTGREDAAQGAEQGFNWIVDTADDTGDAVRETGEQAAQAAVELAFAAYKALASTAEPLVDDFNTWREDAQQGAAQGFEDFAGCPSNAAQSVYNELSSKKADAEAALITAEDIKDQAELAHQSCKETTPASYGHLCDTTYNTLSIHATIGVIEATIASLDSALVVLAALECPAGCDQSVVVTAPLIDVRPGRPVRTRIPGRVDMDVCTQLDLGSFGYDVGEATRGNVFRAAEFEAPSCGRTERISFCSNYDVEAVLPALQRLRIVPPSVEPGQLTIDVPTRTVSVPVGVRPTRCRQPINVCTAVRGNANLDFDSSQSLLEVMGEVRCSRQTAIGCSSPPFGLRVDSRRVTIPDPQRTTVSWRGPRIRPGEVEVDFTRGRLALRCRPDRDFQLDIPTPPRVVVRSQDYELPYLCMQSRWTDLVANQ